MVGLVLFFEILIGASVAVATCAPRLARGRLGACGSVEGVFVFAYPALKCWAISSRRSAAGHNGPRTSAFSALSAVNGVRLAPLGMTIEEERLCISPRL